MSSDSDDIRRLVASASNQLNRDLELIFVPDSPQAARALPQIIPIVPTQLEVKILDPPSLPGASLARNTGASSAKGSILGFLDDDVELDSHWSTRLVETFTNPSIGAVSGRAIVNLPKSLRGAVPNPLLWVVGGTYWVANYVSEVFGGAGMNFCVRKELFFQVGGYDVRLGPSGDRPELANWRRVGAEESELALRIRITTGKLVVQNPMMITIHRLRHESGSIRGVFRRAEHVGYNRAYIHSTTRSSFSASSDVSVLRDTLHETLAVLFKCNPLKSWKTLSFSCLVMTGFLIGYGLGRVTFRPTIQSRSQGTMS